MTWRIAAVVACAALSAAAGGGPQAAAAPAVVVVLETGAGRIEIEVDGRAPATAANFLRYVDAGFYDGGEFHRAVRPSTETRTDFPIQVVQARMDPARRREAFPPIAMESTAATGLRHLDGTVSMARSGPDTATHEFFICLGDQPELDHGGRRNADGQGFAAFGRVTAGMDVVRRIQAAPVRAGTQTLEPVVKIHRVRRKA